MLFNKITIKNFRSHKLLTFEPKETGITAIQGANGAGKSTIVDAFAWSLYGTKPHGLKNKDFIREGVNPKESPVEVITYLTLGNRKYKVQRTIVNENGGVKCNVYSKDLKENQWKFECGPSISHADAFIRKVLNVDEKGFLSSIFVQQKQVDQIITASPAERAVVIEKLIGVSAITEAISLIKEESKDLQRAANVIQVGSIEDKKQQLDDKIQEAKDLKTHKDKLEQDILNLSVHIEKEKERFNIEKEKQEELDNLGRELELIKQFRKQLNNELSNLIDISETTKLKSGRKVSVDVIQSQAKDLEEEKTELSKSLTELKNKKKILDSIFIEIIDLKSIKKDIKSKTQEKEKISEELLKYKEEIILINSELKRLNNYIELLQSGQDEITCYTCNNKITDVEKELTKSLNNLEKYSSRLKDLKSKGKSKNKLLLSIEEVLKDLDEKKVLGEKQKENSLEYKKIDSLITDKEANLLILEKEYDIIYNKLLSAKAEEHNRDLITKTKEKIKILKAKIKENSSKQLLLEESIKQNSAIPKKEYKELENNLLSAEKELNNNKNLVYRINSDLDSVRRIGQIYLEEYNKCVKSNEEYKEMTKELSIVNSSFDNLVQFKAERIKTSIPALEEIASTLVSKITDGKFTNIIVTEKFETFVQTKEGSKRPVAMLSGGELSVVAISLRLAIALFLLDNEQNLLILDEILVSMSEDRTELILDTIANLKTSQIIIIAHNPIVNSFADKIFNI